MRILFTNNALAIRGGSEMYVRDVALAMMRRGHHPMVYSTVLGEVAEELRRATIPVLSDLTALRMAPDLIHGQHHLEAMTALLRFPQTPAIYVCHGWLPREEHPPVFPSIRRYLAVDELCRERLLTTSGIAADQVEVLYNFVDLERFRVRSDLPDRPRTALIFSNYATQANYVPCVREACRRCGIQRVDVAGIGAENSLAQPELRLAEYDVVFAKARCALEAMAAGCAVVVADRPGLGGLVTSHNMQAMRRLNFGVRTLQAEPLSEDAVVRELLRYRSDEAQRVTKWIRSVAGMDGAIDRLLEVYAQVAHEEPPRADPVERDSADRFQAASDYLRILTPTVKDVEAAQEREQQAIQNLLQISTRLEQTQAALDHAHRSLGLSQESLEAATRALHQSQQRATVLEQELQTIYQSRSWKAITWYRRLRTRLSARLR